MWSILLVIAVLWLGCGVIAFILSVLKNASYSFWDDVKAFFIYLALGPYVLYLELTDP